MDQNDQTMTVEELLDQDNRNEMIQRAQELFVIDRNHNLIPFDQKLALLRES